MGGAVEARLGKILSELRRVKSYYVPGFEVGVRSVDVDFIARRLAMLPNWGWFRWFPLDGTYYTVSLEDFRRIISWDRVNWHRYTLDRFDCDKYALYFKSSVAYYFGLNAVAVVLDYSSAHAYNLIFPFDVGEPLILEPQTDEVFRVSERDVSLYALRDYYVLI